jgi:hypothetical protein
MAWSICSMMRRESSRKVKARILEPSVAKILRNASWSGWKNLKRSHGVYHATSEFCAILRSDLTSCGRDTACRRDDSWSVSWMEAVDVERRLKARILGISAAKIYKRHGQSVVEASLAWQASSVHGRLLMVRVLKTSVGNTRRFLVHMDQGLQPASRDQEIK